MAGLCVLTAVQSDPCMEDGREEGMCEAVRLGSCQRGRRLAAVLAEAWWEHPDRQQVITRQRATWMHSTMQECSLLMHVGIIGHHEMI